MQNNKSVSRRSSVKMAGEKKGRGTNFGADDRQLLAQVIESTSKFHKNMTNHQLHKHRFESGITSQTKKAMWVAVAEEFNCTATVHRTREKLEKKWNNITAKHRLNYSDVQREMALTGGGGCSKTARLLTNQVMDVIGRTTDDVNGAETTILDSSYMAFKSICRRDRDLNMRAHSVQQILTCLPCWQKMVCYHTLLADLHVPLQLPEPQLSVQKKTQTVN